MSQKLIVRPLATTDIEQAAHWYEEQTIGLGRAFVRHVDAALAEIQNQPGLYPIVYRSVRRVILRRFPYSIYFVARPDTIQVIACMHARRDPKSWQVRERGSR